MKAYVKKLIPREDLDLFHAVKKSIKKLPDLNLGRNKNGEDIILSCHMLARAVAQRYPELKVVDGFFYPNFNHSWCVTNEGNIIDVYPVAIIGGPFLISGDSCSPAHWLYVEKDIKNRTQLSFSDELFEEAVRKIKEFL